MRILYISSSYVPSRRASSIQVMKTCESMSKLGHEVRLVTKLCLPRQEPGVPHDFHFYGVKPIFEIKKMPRPVMTGGGLLYLWNIDRHLARGDGAELVYARELGGALLAVRRRRSVVFEAHGPPESGWQTRLFRRLLRAERCRRLVVISRALLAILEAQDLIPQGLDIVVAHDGADPSFTQQRPLEPAERKGSRPRYGYAGQLYPGKGMEVLIPLALAMPHADFVVLGGTPSDIDHWKSLGLPSNLDLQGFAPPGEVGPWLDSCDALLIPVQQFVRGASGDANIAPYMSPLKLFDYMAAGKPIVASRLPVLGEILRDGENALMAEAEAVEEWQRALERLESDTALASRLGRTAKRDFIKDHTWLNRTQRILDGI